MKVLVTGGSGFVGTTLCARLLEAGHEVSVLTRSQKGAERLPQGVAPLLGDPTAQGPWQDQAAAHDAFVNLAGASIFNRWSMEYKALIRSSRILTTRNLVQAMGRRPEGSAPAVLVSASAVGYYGPRGDEELSEDDQPGSDFLASVCMDWEGEALQARDLGARVVCARFGIVLGTGGGALGQMLPLFRLGLGGPLGSGQQWFSWIHQQDLVGALIFCLEKDMSGPANCCAPAPVTNRELAASLGRVLHRPAFLPAPGFAIKLAMGEMGSMVLTGQRVLPQALLRAGFSFQFPELEGALRDLLG
ncbi:MAG: TIGR01777 family oxidoreductase [Desulfarculaceae bacterium]|nr:TIGR01777 family oxidoreductase [Desulfarculaceae bacterium]MCF8073772.1 TIGR01777 family oxidoreductase [Desulfarculaceae bacterium]MCF8102013.1 TIGR01777 family oxidoreductase [Desulfarculaceae bacterium]MCF8115983.1 TIGR01777 family oxidoreductase [Desulfarculaceae bacterium]